MFTRRNDLFVGSGRSEQYPDWHESYSAGYYLGVVVTVVSWWYAGVWDTGRSEHFYRYLTRDEFLEDDHGHLQFNSPGRNCSF